MREFDGEIERRVAKADDCHALAAEARRVGRLAVCVAVQQLSLEARHACATSSTHRTVAAHS